MQINKTHIQNTKYKKYPHKLTTDSKPKLLSRSDPMEVFLSSKIGQTDNGLNLLESSENVIGIRCYEPVCTTYSTILGDAGACKSELRFTCKL